MERLYRLEFNEKQQNFHLDNYTHENDTYGWITIADHCSDLEFQIFDAFINCKGKKKFTNEYVLKTFSELKKFINKLMEYNISIG